MPMSRDLPQEKAAVSAKTYDTSVHFYKSIHFMHKNELDLAKVVRVKTIKRTRTISVWPDNVPK